jgi:CDP-diacylglycerol--serine O-phosphatidyltransferase
MNGALEPIAEPPVHRRRGFQRTGLSQMIPNVLTVGALCGGLVAILFALDARWEHAVLALTVAGILDGLDGRMARLLNVTSKFGAELDSLSDFASFGVAPAVILYVWSAKHAGGVGIAASLFYAVCCALRLARFNTALGDPNPPPWARYYFTGVPAPAGAGLAVLPLLASFEIGGWPVAQPMIVSLVLFVVGALMVSRIPTFSIKQIKLSRTMMLPTLIVAALLAGALASAPWRTFLVTGLAYLASIPVSVVMQRRAKRKTPSPAEPSSP